MREERYVHSYATSSGTRWSCWQRQDGRYRRVGTAHTIEQYLIFLGFRGEELAEYTRTLERGAERTPKP